MKKSDLKQIIKEEIDNLQKLTNLAKNYVEEGDDFDEEETKIKYKPLIDVGILIVDEETYGDGFPVVDTTHPTTKKLKTTNPQLWKLALKIENDIS